MCSWGFHGKILGSHSVIMSSGLVVLGHLHIDLDIRNYFPSVSSLGLLFCFKICVDRFKSRQAQKDA